ncbi:MAG: dipeptidase [Bacteroidales bacterium]|nr:dipeptidase [Bacteroidales bacterium]
MNYKSYISENQEQFLSELFTLLRIPSVSAKPEHKDDMVRCAEAWRDQLLASGVDKAELLPSAGNPIVFAERIVNDAAPTVLVYAHYDVMPAEPFEKWNSNPFEPVIIDNHIVARGADDDKGQSFIQLKGFEIMNKHDLLKCNVKFLIEGEEEIGSPSLEAFCEANKALLKADVILVSDTSMLSKDTPSITTGLRGLAYWQVEVTGPNRDLHSGIFGGAVANPINELCKLIASVTDENGKITVPEFYDDVEELSPREREMMAQIPHSDENYAKALDVNALHGEKGYSTLERTATRPTFDVCGIWGGYTGEGSKTVLPSKAFAKLSCRLVPHQNHETIAELMKDYLEKSTSSAIKIKVESLHGGEAYVCPIDLPAYKAAEIAYAKAFNKPPLAVRRGGSIPIISVFERVLETKTVLMGFGLESNAIHSPNENYPIDLWLKGIETICYFYEEYSK